MGIIDKRKNVERLILSFGQIVRNNPDIHLVIAGRKDDPNYSLQENLDILKQAGFENRVLQIGFVPDEDLPTLYAGAELFVFVSLYEGFGRTIIESMACGVPVVTSNITSLPEIAKDAAIFVDPYDIGSISQGIEKGMRDNGLRRKLIEKGIKRANKFSNKILQRKWLNFILK